MIILIITISLQAFAQMPISTDTLQLRQLINNSEQQIKALREILKYSKQDTASLNSASHILKNLSEGIDKTIEKYQGTDTYEKALLELQLKDDFKNNYSDAQELRKNLPRNKNETASDKSKNDIFVDAIKFQKKSVQANESDFKQRKALQKELIVAPPGLIPKLEAQVLIGNWQTNTRVSIQMTELLATIHAMREELRILRKNENQQSNLNTLVMGAEILNQKQKRHNQK
ncbi:MAG: hypothetical protein H6625_00725 [Bdellovibrionaceae bacterium]|nr:hypothetical protein [Pseudobdellovibrionaceae bacterium]